MADMCIALHSPLATMRFRKIGSTVQKWGVPRVRGRTHAGWDLLADPGTPIYAVDDGVIDHLGFDPNGYGDYFCLRFITASGPRFALYAHLHSISVDANPVTRGQVLGTTGTSGNAGKTGGGPPHLHFEVKKSLFSGAEDPASYFSTPAY